MKVNESKKYPKAPAGGRKDEVINPQSPSKNVPEKFNPKSPGARETK